MEKLKCPICEKYTVIDGVCKPCTDALCRPLTEWDNEQLKDK